MKRHSRWFILACFAASGALCALRPLPANAAEESKPAGKLTQQQSAELLKLLNDYRLPGRSETDKDQIVDRIFDLGAVGVKMFSAQIEKQVRPQLDRYRDRFFKQALALVASKTKSPVSTKEIADLRAAVLALKEKKDLTKEEIERVGDPAMKRLSELLVIDRKAVLQAAPDLEKERAKLTAVGKYWERCLVFQNGELPEDQRAKDPPNFGKYLLGEEELAAGMAMPIDQGARAVLTANERLVGKIDHEEAQGILACNLTRILLGLNPCAIDLKLVEAARGHSHDMETLKFFSHESPVAGKKTPWDRAKLAGTSASAENIFVGNMSGKVANEAWFHSPGHHKNMLADHVRIGIGRSGNDFAEMFGN